MLTQSELKQLLDYNSETGVFTWKVKPRPQNNIGDVAGTVNNRGYMRITINKKSYLAHRLAWLYTYGELPKEQIDHINHERTDNRIENLRVVSHQENLKNKSVMKNNTSGFTGVSWRKDVNKWIAHIRVNHKRIHLGYFTDIIEAITVRKQAESQYNFHQNHGE